MVRRQPRKNLDLTIRFRNWPVWVELDGLVMNLMNEQMKLMNVGVEVTISRWTS